MEAALVDRIEIGVERGASALFAAAAGYAAYGFTTLAGVQPQLALVAAGAGALAYLPCSRMLSRVGRRHRPFEISLFADQNFEFADPSDELLLTERVEPEEMLLTDRVDPDELLLSEDDRLDSDAPLVLDDILAEMGPDSRVVRLFDRSSMPAATPGQLQERVAQHMKDGTASSAPSNLAGPSDASQALSAALAELRRSLR